MSSFFAMVDLTVYINDCYSSDECWIHFYAVLCGAIRKFVPKRHIPKSTSSVIKNKIKNSKKIFYNKSIRKKLGKKAALWRKYNKNRSAANKVAYAEISRSCKNLQDQYAKDIERKVVAAGDLGTFYRYVNSKLSSRSGVAPLCTGDNTYITDTKSQANLLNTYFGSVCTSDNGIVPVCDAPAPVAPLLTNVKFTHKKIFHIMSNLKKSFAAGPDGLPPFFFKKMARSLAYPVAELCTLFFSKTAPCHVYGKQPSSHLYSKKVGLAPLKTIDQSLSRVCSARYLNL